MKFELLSSAFISGSMMPDQYTDIKNQVNISPPLNWISSPNDSVSYAILVDDLNSPFNMITHWIIYNIPPVFNKLEENISKTKNYKNNILQGINWKNQYGYTGPNPLFGKHRYRFTIYALDHILNKDKKITKIKFLSYIKDHIIDSAKLIGCYKK